MSDPLLSIITTSYNRSQYLGSAIESVLAQDYGDFEYLILEDGSPDDSLAVARSYEHDSRLRVIANPRNLGDYGNRNKGLNLARGKYVKFVDCDDLLYPHCVGSMLTVAEAFPEAGVIFASREGPPWQYPLQLSPEAVYRLHFTAGEVLHQGPLGSLLQRDAILAVGGFPELYTGDVACWLNLAREYPVALMSGGLYWWREHSGQLSESLRSASVKWANHQAEGARLHWEALNHPDCPLPAEERTRYQKVIERDYHRMLIRYGLRGRWQIFNELRKGNPFGGKAAITEKKSDMTRVAESQPAQGTRVAARPIQRRACRRNDMSGAAPVISVLLPNADEGAKIRDTIESIFNQDHDDWELIIMLDESRRCNNDIVTEYADDPRVRLIWNPTQVERWTSHNECIRLARGRYLKFAQAGDTLNPSALRTFAWYASKFPEAGMIVSCADERYLMPQNLSPIEIYQAEATGILSLMESPSGVLYRNDALTKAGSFENDCPEASAKLHLNIGQTAQVVFIYGGLVHYVQGSAALRISSTRGAARSKDELAVLRTALAHTKCPLSVSDRLHALNVLTRQEQQRKWENRWGRSGVSRKLKSIIYPNLPPFAALANLSSGEGSFVRSLYPERT